MFFLYSMEEIDDFQDLGHTQTIGAILGRLPKQRRTGLFSATEADGVTALCRAGLRNQIKIKIEIKNNDRVQMVPALLKNYYLTLPSDAKWTVGQNVLYVLTLPAGAAKVGLNTEVSEWNTADEKEETAK